MELVRTLDRKWWVINADDGMRDGTIMIHNEKGEFEKIVRLPPGADSRSGSRSWMTEFL
jgi:hypothetical protein